MTERINGQRLSITDALHLNEEIDYRTKIPIKIVEKNVTYNINGKELQDKIIKTFDQAGLLSTFEFYGDNDSLFARSTYVNDSANRKKLSNVVEVWRRNGYSKETQVYSYDTSGFLKGITDLDINGNLFRKTSIICNEKGHPVELSLFDNKGKLIVKERATYFYSTNKVTINIEVNDRSIIENYDSSKISLKNESKYQAIDEAFNSKGDKIKWKGNRDFDKDMFYEREFVYDRVGNWIESKIFLIEIQEDGQPNRKIKSIISREFRYP